MNYSRGNPACSAPLRLCALALTLFLLLIGPKADGQTNQPVPIASSVMVNSNGVVIAPTNFAAANGFNTNGAGISATLAPAKIYIGNALSNAAAQMVGGDASLATNGTLTLTATGTAGTYAQATFDSKGRETSGATVLPINAGGTGQTTAAAGLSALGGASLTASNVLSGGQNVTGPLRVTEIMANAGLSGTGIVFDEVASAGDQAFDFTGNAISSGNGITLDILGTNNDSSLATNRLGHRILDQANIVGVGNGAIYADFPGTMLFISPQTQMIFGHNNSPRLVIAGNGASVNHIGIPYLGASTNQFPYVENLKNGTNTYVQPADVGLMLDADVVGGTLNFYAPSGITFSNGTALSGANGIWLKSTGKLANNVAFDPTDNSAVALSDAAVTATNYAALNHTWYSTTSAEDFDAGGNNSGMNYSATVTSGIFCLQFGLAGKPSFVTSTENQAWAQTGGNEGFLCVGSGDLQNGATIDNALLEVHGSFATGVASTGVNITISKTNSLVLLNAATLVATLPDATQHCKGRIYTIKEIASGTTGSVQTSGVIGQKIDGATNYSLSAQFKYVTVQSDGTQWWIISNN